MEEGSIRVIPIAYDHHIGPSAMPHINLLRDAAHLAHQYGVVGVQIALQLESNLTLMSAVYHLCDTCVILY